MEYDPSYPPPYPPPEEYIPSEVAGDSDYMDGNLGAAPVVMLKKNMGYTVNQNGVPISNATGKPLTKAEIAKVQKEEAVAGGAAPSTGLSPAASNVLRLAVFGIGGLLALGLVLKLFRKPGGSAK